MSNEAESEKWLLVTLGMEMAAKLLDKSPEEQEEIIASINDEGVREAVREALEKAKTKKKQ